jgi:hypothetical protein
MEHRALTWLAPVVETLPDLTPGHADWLERVEDALRDAGDVSSGGFVVALPPLGDLDEPGPATAFALAGVVCGWHGLRDTLGTVSLPAAAVALGEAAAAHTRTTAELARKVIDGDLPGLGRDVLVTLGARHGDLIAAVLSVLAAARLETEDLPQYDLQVRAADAHAMAAAHCTLDDLASLNEDADGFKSADLGVGEHYADILRSVGHGLVTAAAGHPSMRARAA